MRAIVLTALLVASPALIHWEWDQPDDASQISGYRLYVSSGKCSKHGQWYRNATFPVGTQGDSIRPKRGTYCYTLRAVALDGKTESGNSNLVDKVVLE